MFTRLFWSALFGAIAWVVWRLFREREESTGDVSTPAYHPVPPTETALPETASTPPAEEASQTAPEESEPAITGYCMRCKARRELNDAQIETTENGRRAVRGTCSVCGGNVFTFIAKE